MSQVPFWELVVIAFLAQLAVLPGEKVQLIIAGLSTRYNPLVVVAAAGSAFAGWTVVEIYFGNFVREILPGLWLSVFTGTMFLLFAVLLWRSAPAPDVDRVEQAGVETDGGGTLGARALDDVGLFGREVPDALGGFVPIFALMAAGEFGDKTQIITITLAASYGVRPGIWVGEMLAIVPVSLLNAYCFHRFSHRFDARKAHLVGAVLFGFFAFDTGLELAFDVSIWETVVAVVAEALVGLV